MCVPNMFKLLTISILLLWSRQTVCGRECKISLVDLSHPYDENTIYWLDSLNFRVVNKIRSATNFFYASNDFESGEHGGTHLDAPYHFNENGWKVADIPVERLFVNGIKIDAKAETLQNPNYGLEVSKLIDWERRNGNITCPTVIVVDFGWAKQYSDRNAYFGSITLQESDLHFPGFSPEAGQWIAEHEHVVGVGLDTPSGDTGENSLDPQVHIRLTGASKYILENLALDGVTLPEKGFKLYITPMKIKEGTGAPCRVIASVPSC